MIECNAIQPADEKNYKVGIVVLTYNCIDYTRGCLSSLRALAYPDFMVVVVDNASTDGSPDIIRKEFPEVTLLPQSENLGFTGGSNVGIQWCLAQDFDAVLLLNNDTVVAPDFLAWMVPHLACSCMVTPKIVSMNQPEVFGVCMGEYDLHWGVWRDNVYGKSITSAAPSPVSIGMAAACCLLIPKQVFECVGNFDDNYFLYYEDVDLITRAKHAGFDLIYEPEATVSHNERTSSGPTALVPLLIYYNVRNRLYFVSKYSQKGKRYYLFLCYFVMTRILYMLLWTVQGNFRNIRATLCGIRDYTAGSMGRTEYRW